MSPNGNDGGVRVPTWLAAILLPAIFGFILWAFQTMDAKAERAERATIRLESRMETQGEEVLRRLGRIEAKLDKEESPPRTGR